MAYKITGSGQLRGFTPRICHRHRHLMILMYKSQTPGTGTKILKKIYKNIRDIYTSRIRSKSTSNRVCDKYNIYFAPHYIIINPWQNQ